MPIFAFSFTFADELTSMPKLVLILIFILTASVGSGSNHAAADNMLDSLYAISIEKLAMDGEKTFYGGDSDKALKIYTVICKRYDQNASSDLQKIFATAFERYGSILYSKGAYAAAMDSYLNARRIAENFGFPLLIARAFTRIGNIYAASGDYNSAIDFYSRAIASPVIKDDRITYLLLINNLFAANLLLNDTTKANAYLKLYKKELMNHSPVPRDLFNVTLAEGLLCNAAGNYGESRRLLDKAVRMSRENHLPPLCEGSALSSLAAPLQMLGRYDEAIIAINDARHIVDSLGNGRLLVETLKDLTQLYERRGMTDSAMAYRSMYLNLADTIAYQEEISKLKSSQMLYELDKSASTIRNLNEEKSEQRTLLIVIGSAALIFIILILILIMQNKKLRLAWSDLYMRNSRQLLDEMKYKKTIADMQDKLDNQNLPDQNLPDEGQRKAIVDSRAREEIAACIAAYMENSDDYCSADFSLDRLADAIGYNPRYVSETINTVLDKNFRSMLNEYRIKKAMLRLEDTEHYGNYTIKAISEGVGYKSQATFISVFTKITGLKPSIYQKLALEKKEKMKTPSHKNL